ncbi:hypothetical protein T09_2032 [Trichinella sp. T9]|nr:hypothetical protein T09_2032 [Trichinella sp. T9]
MVTLPYVMFKEQIVAREKSPSVKNIEFLDNKISFQENPVLLWSSAYDWNMNLSMISVMVVMLFLRNSAIRILTVISPFESTTRYCEMALSGVLLHSKIQNHCHAVFDENGFDVGNVLDVELYSSLIELLLLEKLLACVMIRPNAPGFVKTFPRIFDRDIPEQKYPFSYFNQAHSRVPPMSL